MTRPKKSITTNNSVSSLVEDALEAALVDQAEIVDREVVVKRVADLEAKIVKLAKGLISIAEIVMPDSLLESDSRVRLARSTLEGIRKRFP